jgi:SAM-dependent methyltransferase
MMSDLYKHPEEYDREHLGDDEDIGFYLSLSRRLAPRKVLELGCGTGRITLPLAQLGFDVIGLDNQPEMLQKAEERRLQAASEIRDRVHFIKGDMRTWSSARDFDLILIPASSITHVHSLEDQLAVWKTCHENLRPGGRLLVEVTMPNFGNFKIDPIRICFKGDLA